MRFRFLSALGSALRTTWLVVGMCFVLVLSAELLYRGQGAVRRKFHPPPPPARDDPLRNNAWWPDYRRALDRVSSVAWKPYVYFRRSPGPRGTTLTVDSLGHRFTPQPTTGAVKARVFLFGGSTMWGYAERDSFTMAAVAAARLQALAGNGGRIEVVNFGESGYVSTQELVELILQLRAGARPDVVVFVDGINDALATLQDGAAGIPQNEVKREKEFKLGRILDRGAGTGVRDNIRAQLTLAALGLGQLQVVQKLQKSGGTRRRVLVSADSAARELVAVYAENVRIIEALSNVYGFTPVYVWQPTLHAMRKPLTPFERRLIDGIKASQFQSRLQQVHQLAGPLADSAVGGIAHQRFVNLTNVFQTDSSAVYVDEVGHYAESAVPHVVDGFWPALQAALAQRRSPH